MSKNEIREFLIECALQHKTVDYMELYYMVYGFISRQDFRFAKLWRQLTAIGADELKAGRPAINCLVVNINKGNIPGKGYYSWWNKAYGQQLDFTDENFKKSVFKKHQRECEKYWRYRITPPILTPYFANKLAS